MPSFETSGIPSRIAAAAIQRLAVCALCPRVALREARAGDEIRAEDVCVDDDPARAVGRCSRLDGFEEGDALVFGEVLDHHLVVRRQRTGATK